METGRTNVAATTVSADEIPGAARVFLRAHHRKDIILTPLRRADRPGHPLSYGAFDADGRLMQEFMLRRLGGAWPLGDFATPSRTIEPTHVYGGVLSGHFGHFLVESLARAWWMRMRPRVPVVWHATDGAVSPWQAEILAMLGIGGAGSFVLEQPTLFRHLVLPDPGFMIESFLAQDQAEALAAYPFRVPLRGKRVWLSRSGLSPNLGIVAGEAEVERELAARGWSIVAPERLTVLAQLETLADAEVVAGFEGSAFHILLLAQQPRAAIRIVARSTGLLNPSYGLIAAAKGLAQTSLRVALEPMRGAGRVASYKLHAPQDVIDFVDAP
ncbi:DUF563 domain-containing protein [Roseomonas sp. HF4]|uniref:glycosyltransferase family 61 protein n=1 Tax=Roseomonas sp. HF4 TaxID=2562313 RepID=UPI0014852413|nr:glycosyltransferase 61 family protein [Roseomonas sp. HF4]